MKKFFFSILLLTLATTATAADLVTGKSYRLTAPDGRGTLADRENTLVLADIDDETSTFTAEACADGIVLRCGTGRYVLAGTEGEPLRTGARYAETLPAPRAYTIQVSSNASNVLLKDKSTGLQLNMYINGQGAALHSGLADASQWRILPADGGQAVGTTPTEGTDYYLQSRMTANEGWYAFNDGGKIRLKQTADESCRFRFIAAAPGEWYIHHVATGTEITGGAQGQLVSLTATSTEEPEDLAQHFVLASGQSQDASGITLKAAGKELFLGLTGEGTVALTAESMAWNAEPVVFPRPDAYYHIVSMNNDQAYMTEEKSGAIVVKGYTPAVRCFWQFVPTDREGCYYIKNATTGRYIESTNKQPSSASTISTSETPVAFYVGKNTTEGTPTFGAWYFSSTDCDNHADATKSPRALNKDGASSNIIVWTAGQSDRNSYWNIVATDYLYDPTRSTYARNNQIYQLPCGTKGQNYIEALSIHHCAVGMDYPRSIAQGDGIANEDANPSTWYTLYTADKAVVEQGQGLTLALTLKNEPQPGDELFAYFDWDGDGVFETAHTLGNSKNIEKYFDVPLDAKTGKTRLRLRLTANGLDEAEDDVAGQTIDLMLYVVDVFGESPVVEVKANAPDRGRVSQTPGEGHEVIVSATPKGNATFVCWKEGNQVRSTEPTYTFTPVNQLTRLTAVFTPNTSGTDAISTPEGKDAAIDVEVTATGRHIRVICAATLCKAIVYTPSGAPVARAEGLNPTLGVPAAGTYIVKVYAPTGHAAKKITVK